jgi:invasion protein IalB
MKVFEGKWALAMAGAVFGAMLGCGSALAQDQGAAAPIKPAVFDTWRVRCTTTPSPGPCIMYQEVTTDQRTNQVLVAISIAYVPSMDRYTLQVVVPLGMAIPKGLTIQTDSYTSPVLHYRRCDRNGCYIEMAADKSIIQGIASSSGDGKGKVNVTVDNGKRYALSFFLKGFAAAHDDMVSEAKAKAKTISQAPAAPVLGTALQQ